MQAYKAGGWECNGSLSLLLICSCVPLRYVFLAGRWGSVSVPPDGLSNVLTKVAIAQVSSGAASSTSLLCTSQPVETVSQTITSVPYGVRTSLILISYSLGLVLRYDRSEKYTLGTTKFEVLLRFDLFPAGHSGLRWAPVHTRCY